MVQFSKKLKLSHFHVLASAKQPSKSLNMQVVPDFFTVFGNFQCAARDFTSGTRLFTGQVSVSLVLRVIICLEKLFYKILFFCDFDMILLWFCYDFLMGDFMFFLPLLKTVMISIWFSYGLGVFHFLLMKFVMAGRIFFVKKIILSFFWTFQNGKTINYLY